MFVDISTHFSPHPHTAQLLHTSFPFSFVILLPYINVEQSTLLYYCILNSIVYFSPAGVRATTFLLFVVA